MPRRKKPIPRKRIEIRHFYRDQQEILYWGVLCGYCGDKPGMPVNFLMGNMDILTDNQKTAVIDFVRRHVGEVKRTVQTAGFFRDK